MQINPWKIEQTLKKTSYRYRDIIVKISIFDFSFSLHYQCLWRHKRQTIFLPNKYKKEVRFWGRLKNLFRWHKRGLYISTTVHTYVNCFSHVLLFLFIYFLVHCFSPCMNGGPNASSCFFFPWKNVRILVRSIVSYHCIFHATFCDLGICFTSSSTQYVGTFVGVRYFYDCTWICGWGLQCL